MSTFRMHLAKVVLILIGFMGAGQVKAQEATAMGPAAEETKSRWMAPQSEQVKTLNQQAAMPARVRIGLRLTPFKKVVTRHADGSTETRFIPGEPLRHTLRARLNQGNHFYVGDWHVETIPTKWIQKTRRYEVQLNLYRRYGAFGQLEENVGSVVLSGDLEEQADGVHVLVGVVRQRLRDKFGNPYLDVIAGSQPAAITVAPATQVKAPSLNPSAANKGAAAAAASARF